MGQPHNAHDEEREAERANLATVIGDDGPDALTRGIPANPHNGEHIDRHRDRHDGVAHVDQTIEGTTCADSGLDVDLFLLALAQRLGFHVRVLAVWTGGGNHRGRRLSCGAGP